MLAPTKICLLMLGVAVPLATAPAPAAAQDLESVSVTVEADDLDLSTETGRRTLQRRIDRATLTVCGPAGRSVQDQARFLECRGAAAARAASAADQFASRRSGVALASLRGAR